MIFSRWAVHTKNNIQQIKNWVNIQDFNMADEQVAQPQESSKPKKQQDPAVGAIANVNSTIKAIINKLNGVTSTLQGYDTTIKEDLFATIEANTSTVNTGYNAIIKAALAPPKQSETTQLIINSDSTTTKPDKKVSDMIKGVSDIAKKLNDLLAKEAITNYTAQSDTITKILEKISPEGQDSPIKTAVEQIRDLAGQFEGLAVNAPNVASLKTGISNTIKAVGDIISKLADVRAADQVGDKKEKINYICYFDEDDNGDKKGKYNVQTNVEHLIAATGTFDTPPEEGAWGALNGVYQISKVAEEIMKAEITYDNKKGNAIKTTIGQVISTISGLIKKLSVLSCDDTDEEAKKENPFKKISKFGTIQKNMEQIVGFLTDEETGMLIQVEKIVKCLNGREELLKYKKAGPNEQTPLGVVNSVIGDVAKCIASVVKIFSNPKSTGTKIAREFAAGGSWKDTYEMIDEYDKDVAGYIENLSNILGKGGALDVLLTTAVNFNDRWDQPLKAKFGKITETKKNKEGKDEDVKVDQETGLSLAAMIVKNVATIVTQIVGAMDAVEIMTGKVQKGGYGMFHVITFLDSMINVLINFDDKWFPTLDARWGKITVIKKLKLKNDKGGEVLEDISDDVFKTNSYTILVAVFGQVVKCLELIKDILDDKNVDEVVNNPGKIKKKLSSLPVLFEFVVETITTSVAKLDAVITSEDKAKGIAVLLTSIASILKNMFEAAKLLEENSKIYKGKKYRKMMKQVRGYIDDVCDLIRYISVKAARVTKTSETAQKGTDAIAAVFKNLLQIPILLLKIAGVFLLALVVSPLIMLALVSMYGLIKFITWLFKSKTMVEDTEKIKQGVDNVTTTIKTLIKLCLQLMLLAVISVIAIAAMIVVMLFIGALILFVISISKLLIIIDKFDGKSTRIKILHLAKIIKSLVVIAIELIILAPLAIIAIIAMIPVMLFMGALTLFVMGLKLMLIIIDKFDGRKTRAKLWRLVGLILILNHIALSLVLLAIVAVVAIVAMIVVFGFMLALSIFILSIWLIAWLLSKVITKKLIIHLLSLVLVIFILLIISTMILVIALIAIVVVPHWLDILIFMGVMLGVIVITILIGWLAMLAAPIIGMAIVGLILILVLVGIILGIALCLKLIAEIDLDPEAVMKGVRTVLDTAWFVVENVFNPDKNAEKKGGDEENRGFFGWVADRFKDIIGGIAAIVTLLLGIVYLVLVFVAIGLILMIAGCLYLLQQIELNPDLIKTNVGIVLATGDQVIDSIFNRQDPETNQSDGSGRKGFGDWIMEMLGSILGGIGKIMKLILSILYLVMLFIAIGLIAGIVAALNKIAEFNLDATGITKKVGDIFICADAVMAKVYESKEKNSGKGKGGFWANVLKGLGFSAVGDLLNFIADYAYLSRILSAIQMVGKLAGALNTIKDVSVKETQINSSIKSIFEMADLIDSKLKGVDGKNTWENEKTALYLVRLYTSIKNAAKEIQSIPTNLDNQLDNVDKILKVIKSPVSKEALTTHKEMIENYIKFLDKVDKVDLEHLKTTERIFKNMAHFSESINGNFQGLADVLNEKIAPLLEELKELLKEVKPSIEQASKDTQATITDNATGNTVRAAQRAGLPQEQVQQVRQTEEDRKRANYERLAAIDKIVKLLEGEINNGAKVRMV